jgi:hypothetical protein
MENEGHMLDRTAQLFVRRLIHMELLRSMSLSDLRRETLEQIGETFRRLISTTMEATQKREKRMKQTEEKLREVSRRGTWSLVTTRLIRTKADHKSFCSRPSTANLLPTCSAQSLFL